MQNRTIEIRTKRVNNVFLGYFGINSEHWDLGEEVFFDKRWCLFASQLWSWSLLNGVTRSFLVFTQVFFQVFLLLEDIEEEAGSNVSRW